MNFDVIGSNLDYMLLGNWPDGPLAGLALTLLMGLGAALAASLLGILAAMALVLWPPALGRPLAVGLAFLRAIPVLMLIFWSYFLLPLLFGIHVPGILTVMLALSFIGAAFLAQTVQAGIAAIPAGQWQAGFSLGFTRRQTLYWLILPQALRMMLPSFVNQWVSLLKDTSLAYVVGVAELTFVASQVNNREQVYPLEIFAFIALMYFLLCSGLAWLGKKWEAHYARAYSGA